LSIEDTVWLPSGTDPIGDTHLSGPSDVANSADHVLAPTKEEAFTKAGSIVDLHLLVLSTVQKPRAIGAISASQMSNALDSAMMQRCGLLAMEAADCGEYPYAAIVSRAGEIALSTVFPRR